MCNWSFTPDQVTKGERKSWHLRAVLKAWPLGQGLVHCNSRFPVQIFKIGTPECKQYSHRIAFPRWHLAQGAQEGCHVFFMKKVSWSTWLKMPEDCCVRVYFQNVFLKYICNPRFHPFFLVSRTQREQTYPLKCTVYQCFIMLCLRGKRGKPDFETVKWELDSFSICWRSRGEQIFGGETINLLKIIFIHLGSFMLLIIYEI